MKVFIFLSLLVGLNLTVRAQSDSTYKALLKEVINRTGTEAPNKKFFHNMLVELKKKPNNRMSNKQWEVLENELNDFFEKDYPLLVYPIYKKFLSEDDLRNIVIFNQSEAGKKMLNFTSEFMIHNVSIMQIFMEKFKKSMKSLNGY